MKKITCLVITLAFLTMSCSKEDCRSCTGTVTNTGDNADWTVCDDDGGVIRTNNLTGEIASSDNTLPEAVAFLISLGLECND